MAIKADARILARFPAQVGVHRDGHYDLFRNDGAGGAISYAAAINKRPIGAWPTGGGPRGCGQGPAGRGGAGHGYYGVGCGNGLCGHGPAGRGTHTIKTRTPDLDDGTYDLAVRATDQNGNQETDGATATDVPVAGTPEAPTDITAVSFSAATGLVMSWTLSVDDEAA